MQQHTTIRIALHTDRSVWERVSGHQWIALLTHCTSLVNPIPLPIHAILFVCSMCMPLSKSRSVPSNSSIWYTEIKLMSHLLGFLFSLEHRLSSSKKSQMPLVHATSANSDNSPPPLPFYGGLSICLKKINRSILLTKRFKTSVNSSLFNLFFLFKIPHQFQSINIFMAIVICMNLLLFLAISANFFVWSAIFWVFIQLHLAL